MTISYLSRRVSILSVLKSLTVSFIGNLAGSLFFMAIVTGYGGVFDESPAYQQAAVRIAVQKCLNPNFGQIFCRAIGANWLVCFAVFSAMQAREVSSKIMAIWWPTATFVALALDHTIANMFFIPNGIWYGAPISVGLYIWKSMIASMLGNFVGGGLFVGAMYWYLYLTGESGVAINFNLGATQTAVEGGAGPLRLRGRKHETIDGHDPNNNSSSSQGSTMDNGAPMSGIAMELGDHTIHAKKLAEQTSLSSDEKV